jgi:hypothetical protein
MIGHQHTDGELNIALNNARKTARTVVNPADFKNKEEYEKAYEEEYKKRDQALREVAKDQSFVTAHAVGASVKNLTPVSRVEDKTKVLTDMQNKIDSLNEAS